MIRRLSTFMAALVTVWGAVAVFGQADAPLPRGASPVVRRTPPPMSIRYTPPRPPAVSTPPRTSPSPTINRGPVSTRSETDKIVTSGIRRPTPPAPKTSSAAAAMEGLKWKIDLDRPVLLLKPGRQRVVVGEPFALKVFISNPADAEFDRFSVGLRYDPEVLEAVGIDDSRLDGLIAPAFPPTKELARRGVLAYSARLDGSIKWHNQPLLVLHFKALRPAHRTVVDFTAGGEQPTVMQNGETVILGGGKGRFDSGTLGAQLAVRTSDDEQNMVLGWTFEREVEALLQPESPGNPRVVLALSCERRSIAVGETFDVQLLIDNPEERPIDIVDVALCFDPRIMQVVDADQGNFIQNGVNVLDGPYHAKFPFEIHLRNRADNKLGKIYYAAATTRPERLAGRGRLATIRFEALATGAFAPIWFAQKDDGALLSKVMVLGQNALVQPGRPQPSVRGLALKVTPMSAAEE